MDDYGLLFYFSEDFAESDTSLLQHAIAELALEYHWTFGPPEFVDLTQSGDTEEPVRTVGGFLPLSRPDPRPNRKVEMTLYEEVERTINALSAFSAKTGCEFELELGGTYVGDISNGKPDKLVSVGLLEEWRKVLGLSPGSNTV